MATTLSRSQLFELVWSKPRTTLAKELGVSDVAISKHCAKANVPAPPAGYWARLSAGGKSHRALLPMRLPGQSDVIEIGVRAGQWRPVPPEDLEEPLAAPVFIEDLDEQVAQALKDLGKIVAMRDLKTPDLSLARVLAAEAGRQAKYEIDKRSYDKPYFDAVIHQRQLRLFCSLARAFRPLYGGSEVRVEDQWIQGQGHLHHLALHLGFGGVGMSLQFHRIDERHRDRAPKLIGPTTLYVGHSNSHLPPESWSDEPGRKLEEKLPTIVEALLRRAELSLRAHLRANHEWRQKRRRELIERAEAERQDEERQRIVAAEAIESKGRRAIVKLARRHRTAQDIRALVGAMKSRVEAQGGHAQLEAWVVHALRVADGIDPACEPLERVVGPLLQALSTRPDAEDLKCT